MMEDWQSFAFSWAETNSTTTEVAAFEMYSTIKLMKNFFVCFSSVPWHPEKHSSLSEEKQPLDNQ